MKILAKIFGPKNITYKTKKVNVLSKSHVLYTAGADLTIRNYIILIPKPRKINFKLKKIR